MSNDATPCNLLAVYGTLRRRSIFHKLPVAAARLQFFSRGLIRGRLFWQRMYPGLIQDRGIALVELFRIVDPNVLGDLDRYEGFDPRNLRASLFIRAQVLLLNPQVWAWVYFLNLQIPRGTEPKIPGTLHHKDTESAKN
ncbi:MAG: gamma-glutamylcyclotransferase [Verrucomicrobia bacterium]|nr:gamma-glutamylcyclotransferase [Verrucomicrobiota bacterium]MBV8485714.1 gamma-glutamylcyclotransferase [Verrucomicrobiota bacterium]